MAKLFAIAVPVIPGKEGEWNKWMTELKEKRLGEFNQSRKDLGVRERTFLQHTPMGDMVIVTLEGDDPQSAFMNFGSSDSEFAKWFTANVKALHGIDLSGQPEAGALPELIIDSHG